MDLAWVEGADLATGEPVFVPFDVVHLDTCPGARREASPFHWSSNGLASGNHWLEAVCAGLCEVIERDALGLWRRWTARERAARRIAPRTIRTPTCRALLDRIESRGVKVAIWNITSDIGVACFVCRIDDDGRSQGGLGAFWGAGAHLARDVALTRAIAEAAQSRLTYISGARDDLPRALYNRWPVQWPFARLADHWEDRQAKHAFDDVPDNAGATFDDDLSRLLAGLRAAGLTQAIALDLTDQSMGVPVVRIIVPGLEGHDEDGRMMPGPRARARMRAAS
jgi:ribosomal protein S12 methylthiotransferase accessory factor